MKTLDCIKWLWKASGGVRLRVLASCLAGTCHVGASLSFVWVCKKLIDGAESGAGVTGWHLALMLGCMVMQVVFSSVETRITDHADILLKNRLRHRLFSDLMTSRWDGRESFHTGDTLNRVMEDVRVVSDSIIKSVPAVFVAGVQFIAAFSFLFVLEPGLAWTIPCLMLAMLAVSKSYIGRMRRLTKTIRTTESTMQALMQESLQHRVVIHTLERTPYVSDTLADHQEDLREQVLDKTNYSIFARALVQVGFSAGYAAAFLWGVFGISSGTATFGMMTAFLQLVGQIQRPIMNLSRQLPSLINSLTSSERLSELSDVPKEESGEPIVLGNSVGVRFDDVDYSYPGSPRTILKGFTYDFKPGTMTALMGETGAGKSTLMRLMLALLSPDKGKVVMYDNSMQTEVSSRTRCNIIYVPQGNTLMSGTVRENLLLGDPEADDSALYEALHIAAADFVHDLPEGMDTMCGEKGAGLSEGQAQRIAIARSLLRKGGLLLMDEPTASLDSETEQILLERLGNNLDGRTLVIVTHRDAAVSLCNAVVRL